MPTIIQVNLYSIVNQLKSTRKKAKNTLQYDKSQQCKHCSKRNPEAVTTMRESETRQHETFPSSHQNQTHYLMHRTINHAVINQTERLTDIQLFGEPLRMVLSNQSSSVFEIRLQVQKVRQTTRSENRPLDPNHPLQQRVQATFNRIPTIFPFCEMRCYLYTERSCALLIEHIFNVFPHCCTLLQRTILGIVNLGFSCFCYATLKRHEEFTISKNDRIITIKQISRNGVASASREHHDSESTKQNLVHVLLIPHGVLKVI